MKKYLQLFLVIIVLCVSINGQEYVGDDKCKTCHSDVYDIYINSGHPYKLIEVVDNQAPTNPTGVVIPLPEGKSWSDFKYVVGGYGWKARFVQHNGYIYTGDNGDSLAQFNLDNEIRGTAPWVTYHKGEATKPYNYGCFTCHTTGADTTGSWAAGTEGFGTFAQPGIRCESCHGPAGDHVTSPSTHPPIQGNDLKLERCGDCHQRGGRTNAIPISGDFIKHHEQFNEMNASKHGTAGFMTCATCHNTHQPLHKAAEVGFDAADAIAMTCETCHPNKEIVITKEDGSTHTKNTNCVSCHMPKAAKSAIGTYSGNGLAGDVSAHLFAINTDAVDRTAMFDGSVVKLDEEGIGKVTLDFACLNCHTNEDVAWASSYAKSIHQGITVDVEDTDVVIPTEFVLEQNYPNPFNPSTTIKFAIPRVTEVKLNVYSITGELIIELIDNAMPVGTHQITLDATNLASGTYIYMLQAEDYVETKKMLLIK